MGTLWYGGSIYTLRQEGEKVEAVFTKNGKIADTGKIANLKNTYKDEIQKEIDLRGSMMLPGLVDSHMHLIGYGESLLRLDLTTVRSKQELLNQVRMRAEIASQGEWIVGEGWDENNWDQIEIPTSQELSEVAPYNPVLLKRTCRHAIVVNHEALKRANIDKDTPNPPGGIIERDMNGELTGYLKDQAQELVFKVQPKVNHTYLENALTTAIQSAWRLGLTGGHTEDLSYYGDFLATYRAFENVILKNNMPFRAHLLVHHTVIDEWKENGFDQLGCNAFIDFGAMKIFADGALGGRTALLSQPYADDPATNGVAIHSKEQLLQLVEKARSYQLPVAVHAIGDLAFEYVLEAIEKSPTPAGKRDRLIHAQILRKDLVERSKKLSVIFDIQPRFVASDFPWVLERVGAQTYDYLYAWKSLLEEGIALAGGSDAPIEPLDPLLGIHAAVTRTKPYDTQHQVFMAEQRLSMYEALSLFTKGSAYAENKELEYGTIESGKRADFTILNQDLFQINHERILDTKVAATVINEQLVYINEEGPIRV
ncbi:MAG TPA: amidohydrolase [Bacillus sp. (in: firmicutes)]|uniref:amidohydrolase n=1 Tax=Bacillus litorisediminis TaxID=2922713 RepID=UPI001FB032C4|nr:amidohydrolase [Bacillus litorisediminis]HWO75473.1 amidohydrolase [Bacillus sp. (in: firmicutes)]